MLFLHDCEDTRRVTHRWITAACLSDMKNINHKQPATNSGFAVIYYSNRGVSIASFLVQQNQLVASNNFITSERKQGSFLHEHARPLNKRFARRLTRRVCFYQNGASQSSIIEIILLVGLGECARDLTKCVPWVPEDNFFLIDTDCSRPTTRRKVPRRKSFQYQQVYFILGILRIDLWSQGAKCVV